MVDSFSSCVQANVTLGRPVKFLTINVSCWRLRKYFDSSFKKFPMCCFMFGSRCLRADLSNVIVLGEVVALHCI